MILFIQSCPQVRLPHKGLLQKCPMAIFLRLGVSSDWVNKPRTMLPTQTRAFCLFFVVFLPDVQHSTQTPITSRKMASIFTFVQVLLDEINYVIKFQTCIAKSSTMSALQERFVTRPPLWMVFFVDFSQTCFQRRLSPHTFPTILSVLNGVSPVFALCLLTTGIANI